MITHIPEKIKVPNTKLGLMELGVYSEKLDKINNELLLFTNLKEGEYFAEEREHLRMFGRNIRKGAFTQFIIKIYPELTDENFIIPKIKLVGADFYTPEILLFSGNIKPMIISETIEYKEIKIDKNSVLIDLGENLKSIRKESIYNSYKMRHLSLFEFLDKHMGNIVLLMPYWEKEIISFIKRWKKLSWNSKAKENYKNGLIKNKRHIEYRSLDKEEYLNLLTYLSAKINYSIMLNYTLKNRKLRREEKQRYKALIHLIKLYGAMPERFTDYKLERIYNLNKKISMDILKMRYDIYINDIMNLWGE